MSNLTKIVFCLFLFYFLNHSTTLVAQTSNEKNYDWKTYFKNDTIEIQYKYEDCHLPASGTDQEMIYIKIQNFSVQKIVVRWQNELAYGGIKNTPSKDLKSVIISERGVVQGNCNVNSDMNLAIFSKMLKLENVRQLDFFNLNNIKIYPIK